MNYGIEDALNIINDSKAVCVVLKNGQIIRKKDARGIKPIIELYDEGILDGATVVDKVVGKAAAAVMVLGGVLHCHAVTVSRHAVGFFALHGVTCTFDQEVEHIINRSGDGICPMEHAVENIDTPEAAMTAIKNKLSEL